MLTTIVFALIAAVLYALLAIAFWRSGWTGEARPVKKSALLRAAPAAPLLLHTYVLYQSIALPSGFDLGIGNAFSTIVLLTVLIYWIVGFRADLVTLEALIYPVAAVAVLLPRFAPASHILPYADLPAFRVHLLIAMLAYGFFTIAALHAGLMAIVERRLHAKTVSPVLAHLPPLLTMERLLFQMVTAGFVLLTLTLLSGIVFSEELFGQAMKLNHKTLFTILSWVIFAVLLGGRKLYGWRGKTAAIGTLTGFASLFLAYFGSKFVLEILLGRH